MVHIWCCLLHIFRARKFWKHSSWNAGLWFEQSQSSSVSNGSTLVDVQRKSGETSAATNANGDFADFNPRSAEQPTGNLLFKLYLHHFQLVNPRFAV